ncbi:hypothetical protein CHCC14814_0105 [Bacillus paralicheniformis]|nr:hypothetical protein CHCC14814_0105 [Bacillus paralicheniformis]
MKAGGLFHFVAVKRFQLITGFLRIIYGPKAKAKLESLLK